MKSLWLAVIVLCVVLVEAEEPAVFGYELVMGALETMQSYIHALEQKVDQMMADQRLSTKVDSIVAEQSKLTDKIADNTRITASQIDKLRDGMQSNSKALESELKSVITKVDQLMADQRLSKMAKKVDSVMTEQSKLSEKISDHSRTTASQTDKLMTSMQSNGRTLENSLKSVITKVDRLIDDQRLSTISTKVDRIVTATTKTEQILNMTIGKSRCPKNKTNNVYLLRTHNSSPFQVYCENGWIVIQRRSYGILSFNRMWNDYRNGFGDVNGEHWLGLEKMHQITRGGSYELMVVLLDFDGVEKRATYTGFDISSEKEQYRLDFEEFSGGDAGDGLTYHKGMKFSTLDRDNDISSGSHCAESYNGGWWFSNCYDSNLNGLHQRGYGGMDWSFFKDFISTDQSWMMIRQIN